MFFAIRLFFHIALRCNSRQFLIAKGLRRNVLLAVLAQAKQKVSHRLYAVRLMANHLHLFIRPDDASELSATGTKHEGMLQAL